MRKQTSTHLILKFFKRPSKKFKTIDLIQYVQKQMYVTDGTITRQLRNLRQDGKLNYICANKAKMEYVKLAA